MNRTHLIAWAMALWCCAGCAAHHATTAPEDTRIPVILDTDIGDDIDDTWAMVMLLKSPRYDVKLITTENGKAEYRARILARLLTIAGRTDIPIGLGVGRVGDNEMREERWVRDYPLSAYRGKVDLHGVDAMVETINHSPRPITIIAIGPLPTTAMALKHDPGIAAKANLVGMQGSVFKGYGGKAQPDVEFNVRQSVASAQQVFSAPWRRMAITPLDTCGLPHMTIDGDRYAALTQSDDPLVKALIESYESWRNAKDSRPAAGSTTLFDTVAVYMADPQGSDLVNLQKLKIAVTDQGMTVVSPQGREMDVATSWKDLEAYRDHLLNVLLSKKSDR